MVFHKGSKTFLPGSVMQGNKLLRMVNIFIQISHQDIL